jgi:hypothetical protein
MAIDAIYASRLPLAERRRLAARVLACSASVVLPSISAFEPIVVFEGAFVAAEADTVCEAKLKLRALGGEGVRLAARLGRASSLRNGVAHIDVGLAEAIRALLGDAVSRPVLVSEAASAGVVLLPSSSSCSDEVEAEPVPGEVHPTAATAGNMLLLFGRCWRTPPPWPRSWP